MEAQADRDVVERQLSLCQKQYAIAEGQATSRKVEVEEKRVRINELERQLAAMMRGCDANGRG
jgi:polyhydroxyalkanoate synthesis regulator phasin